MNPTDKPSFPPPNPSNGIAAPSRRDENRNQATSSSIIAAMDYLIRDYPKTISPATNITEAHLVENRKKLVDTLMILDKKDKQMRNTHIENQPQIDLKDPNIKSYLEEKRRKRALEVMDVSNQRDAKKPKSNEPI